MVLFILSKKMISQSRSHLLLLQPGFPIEIRAEGRYGWSVSTKEDVACPFLCRWANKDKFWSTFGINFTQCWGDAPLGCLPNSFVVPRTHLSFSHLFKRRITAHHTRRMSKCGQRSWTFSRLRSTFFVDLHTLSYCSLSQSLSNSLFIYCHGGSY